MDLREVVLLTPTWSRAHNAPRIRIRWPFCQAYPDTPDTAVCRTSRRPPGVVQSARRKAQGARPTSGTWLPACIRAHWTCIQYRDWHGPPHVGCCLGRTALAGSASRADPVSTLQHTNRGSLRPLGAVVCPRSRDSSPTADGRGRGPCLPRL